MQAPQRRAVSQESLQAYERLEFGHRWACLGMPKNLPDYFFAAAEHAIDHGRRRHAPGAILLLKLGLQVLILGEFPVDCRGCDPVCAVRKVLLI